MKILIDEETVKQALEALENHSGNYKLSKAECVKYRAVEEALRQAIEQTQKQEPVANGKLKVTLQDTPTEIELAQYKRMFQAACSALGAIGEVLGVDEDEGGAEPILAAIAELKASPPQRQPLTDGEPVSVADELPKGLVPLQKENGRLVYAACMDSNARHYKWLMWRHPDGQWVSKRKLEDWEVMQVEDQEHYGIVQEAAHGITGEQK